MTCETDRQTDSRTLVYHRSYSLYTLWWNFEFSFQSFGTLFIKLYMILRQFFICRTVNWEPLCQFTSNFAQLLELIVLWSVYWSELAKGFSIYSATYEKSPTIWWIKSHNSGMKNQNFTKRYTDHKTINSNNFSYVTLWIENPLANALQTSHIYWNW
jgi:hypothetical protein